jgi:hypothetical protein
VSGTDPAALLAGALRVDQLGDDWRAKVRSDVDRLVDDGVVDAAIADEFAGQLVDDIAALVDDDPGGGQLGKARAAEQLAHPSVDGCVCPSPAGLCRDDCAHCTALPDEAPCPADVDPGDVDPGDDDAASWTPDPLTGAALPCDPPTPAQAAAEQAALDVPIAPALTTAAAEALAGDRTVPSQPTSPAQEDLPPAALELAPPAGNLAARDARAILAHPGWRSRHDPASRSFGVVDRLAGKAPLRDVHLPWTPVLNQGKEGACVGFGVADAVNVLRASGAPVPAFIDDAGALDLYHAAQRVDDIPGESYTGTSVLAGMKAGAGAGLFGGYLWDFGTSAIAQTLLQLHTPVVVGVPWFDGMYDTGPGGVVHVAGKLVGGHCLCIVGLSMKGPNGEPGPWFIWRNSWGESYGVGGDGFVHHRDLGKLLRGQGEAAVPTVTAQKPA